MIGHTSRVPNLVSGASGVWVGISVLVWSIMLPESDTDPDWGQGLWLALIVCIMCLGRWFQRNPTIMGRRPT